MDGRGPLQAAEQSSRMGGATAPRDEYGNLTRPVDDDDRLALFGTPYVVTDTVAQLTDLHFGHAGMIERPEGARALGAAGVASALDVVVSLLAGQVGAAWVGLAIHMVGSWVAAIGLFMLGWSVRGA